MDSTSVTEWYNSAMSRQPSPERGSPASRQALLKYALDFPPTVQELETRMLATCKDVSVNDKLERRRREDEAFSMSAIYNIPHGIVKRVLIGNVPFSHRHSENELIRIGFQSVMSHSRDSLLSRLQRQPAVRKSYMLALSGIRRRCTSSIPSFISSLRASLKFPYRHSEWPSGQIHRGIASLAEPTIRIRSMYARQIRRYVSEPAVEQKAINGRRTGFRVSVSATKGDWELGLIEGSMFEDLGLDHEQDRSLRRRVSGESLMVCQTPVEKLSVEKLSLERVLRTIRVEPEVVDLESPSTAPEIENFEMPLILKVVQAIAVTEEVHDEISPVSDDGAGHFIGDEPVSPMSDGGVHEEPVSPITSDAICLISFEDIPEIKLDPDDWPLPKADTESDHPIPPESEPAHEPPYFYLAELNGHPHPLRSNPTQPHPPLIPQSPSTPSLASLPSPLDRQPHPTIHKKQSSSSIASARNRKAVIIQKKDSSLSLHSQGTITDISGKGTSWLSPSTSALTQSLRDNRRFSGILNLNLKRANATQQSQPHRPSYLRRPSLTLLTPVSETFEKLSVGMRWESGDTRPSASTRPSSFSVVSGCVNTRKKEKRRGMGFNGAMIGHSRRGGL